MKRIHPPCVRILNNQEFDSSDLLLKGPVVSEGEI